MALKNWMLKLVRGFKSNGFKNSDQGTITIEFALLVPALLAMWLGSVAVIDMENATTKVGKVTGTVSDILARSETINTTQIDNAFLAGNALLGDSRNTRLEIYVVGLKIEKVDPNDADEVGTVTVMWARGSQITSLNVPSVGSSYPLPTEVRKRQGFLVASHGKLHHTPYIGPVMGGSSTVEYDYKNYFVPRSSIETSCDNC